MPRPGMELPDWVEAMTKPPSLAATGLQEISPDLALSRAKGDAERASVGLTQPTWYTGSVCLTPTMQQGVEQRIFKSDDHRPGIWFHCFGIVRGHHAARDNSLAQAHR